MDTAQEARGRGGGRRGGGGGVCGGGGVTDAVAVIRKESYQDEESLVGKLLVFGDGREHGQHQTAEHQQETERDTSDTEFITRSFINPFIRY